jgi:RimJ/RimL family protein N-acetyltransferase
MILETDRLTLCPWSMDDLADFRPIATDPEVMRFITGGEPWADERMQAFIERNRELFEEHGYCRWKLVEKATGRLIGFCGPGTLSWLPCEVEIGWWIARDHWGQGFASEAARAAFRHAVEERGLTALVSVAHQDNHASIRIMQKLGMRFERYLEHALGRQVLYRAGRRDRD